MTAGICYDIFNLLILFYLSYIIMSFSCNKYDTSRIKQNCEHLYMHIKVYVDLFYFREQNIIFYYCNCICYKTANGSEMYVRESLV